MPPPGLTSPGRYNQSVERYSYRGKDEARDPIFRSDLEERPEPPRYEPLRPGGGLWSVVKRLLAPLVAAGLLLVKFKWILLALLKVKHHKKCRVALATKRGYLCGALGRTRTCDLLCS